MTSDDYFGPLTASQRAAYLRRVGPTIALMQYLTFVRDNEFIKRHGERNGSVRDSRNPDGRAEPARLRSIPKRERVLAMGADGEPRSASDLDEPMHEDG
jgi:hypothetical protein